MRFAQQVLRKKLQSLEQNHDQKGKQAVEEDEKEERARIRNSEKGQGEEEEEDL